jgi:hypothetical protein
MDYGVLLAAAIVVLAAVCAALVVMLRRRLPVDVLAEVEAVAASIRDALGDLATEQRVRFLAGYIYDVAVSAEQQSRVSRDDFEVLVWQSVERWLDFQGVTQLAMHALSVSRIDNER